MSPCLINVSKACSHLACGVLLSVAVSRLLIRLHFWPNGWILPVAELTLPCGTLQARNGFMPLGQYTTATVMELCLFMTLQTKTLLKRSVWII